MKDELQSSRHLMPFPSIFKGRVLATLIYNTGSRTRYAAASDPILYASYTLRHILTAFTSSRHVTLELLNWRDNRKMEGLSIDLNFNPYSRL